MSADKVIILPDGRKLILPAPEKDADRDLSKVITPSFLKQVPNGTISRRQSKIRHKVKKKQWRGMNGTANRAGAAYAGSTPESMEQLLFQQKFLPKTKTDKNGKETETYKRGGPTTTRPTYDVDTFGLARSSHKRETGSKQIKLPNGKVLKLG